MFLVSLLRILASTKANRKERQLSTTQRDSSPIEPSRDGHRSIGYAHFWDRVARSRRQFMGMVAGVAGLLLGTSLQRPALAQERKEEYPTIAKPFQPLYAFWLETSTDSRGFFSVAHGLPQFGEHYRIEGITVAIQHLNGNWHTLELSHVVDNRFWWNGTVVQGIINSPAFVNRPVRIVLFTLHIVG